MLITRQPKQLKIGARKVQYKSLIRGHTVLYWKNDYFYVFEFHICNMQEVFSIFCPFAFKATSTTTIFGKMYNIHRTNLFHEHLSCFHRQ